jgi:hypothetical protein
MGGSTYLTGKLKVTNNPFPNLDGQYRSINGGELEQVSPTTNTTKSVKGTLNILYTEEEYQEWWDEGDGDIAINEVLTVDGKNLITYTTKLNEENND